MTHELRVMVAGEIDGEREGTLDELLALARLWEPRTDYDARMILVMADAVRMLKRQLDERTQGHSRARD